MIVKLLAELGMSRDLGVADVDVTVERVVAQPVLPRPD